MRISYWSSDVCSSDLPFIGSVEYINGGERWILALQDAQPSEMRAPDVKSILEKVRLFREESSRPVTRELATVPASFAFKIRRDSCRERVCQYGWISVGAESLQQKSIERRMGR